MSAHLRLRHLIFDAPHLATESLMDLAVQWAIAGVEPVPVQARARDEPAGQALHEVSGAGLAILPVHGVLVSRVGHLDLCEPMTSYEGIRAQLSRAVADPGIAHIVLDIDSPGGASAGAFELAADIRAAASLKPVTAIANFSAYSAAYLLASAASEIVVSPSSGTGSIGVVARHLDVSARNAAHGVKVTSVYAGTHKADLDPNAPITDAGLAFLTALVRDTYERFVATVADLRGLAVQAVRDTQAAVVFGQDAIDLGLADRLETPQAAIDRIAAEVAQRRASPMPVQGVRSHAPIAVRAAAMAMRLQDFTH